MSTKGALRTLLWTQLCDALRADYDIELPKRSRENTTNLIDDIVDMLEQEKGECDGAE